MSDWMLLWAARWWWTVTSNHNVSCPAMLVTTRSRIWQLHRSETDEKGLRWQLISPRLLNAWWHVPESSRVRCICLRTLMRKSTACLETIIIMMYLFNLWCYLPCSPALNQMLYQQLSGSVDKNRTRRQNRSAALRIRESLTAHAAAAKTSSLSHIKHWKKNIWSEFHQISRDRFISRCGRTCQASSLIDM